MKLDPVSNVIDAAAKGVETVAGVFTTNKEKEAQRAADEQVALLKAYQSEFNTRENRNWLDSFADGFNRLIRPFIVTTIISIFFIAYISPVHLAEITLALSSIPEGYWTLLSIIIVFYFGGRMQLKSQQFKFNESQVTAVKALIETRKEFKKLELDTDEPDRLVGEVALRQNVVDQERSQQNNDVVSVALNIAKQDSAAALKDKVKEMKNEDIEITKKRRRYGSRHRKM